MLINSSTSSFSKSLLDPKWQSNRSYKLGSVCPTISPSIRPFICPSICPFLCLAVFLELYCYFCLKDEVVFDRVRCTKFFFVSKILKWTNNGPKLGFLGFIFKIGHFTEFAL